MPARFLVQKRRHVPLETLQKDLRLYLEHPAAWGWWEVTLEGENVNFLFLSKTSHPSGVGSDALEAMARVRHPEVGGFRFWLGWQFFFCKNSHFQTGVGFSNPGSAVL